MCDIHKTTKKRNYSRFCRMVHIMELVVQITPVLDGGGAARANNCRLDGAVARQAGNRRPEAEGV